MKSTICKILAPLASLAGQRRFIVHGNKDEYWIPEDIMEEVTDLLNQVKNSISNHSALTQSEREAILGLEPLLKSKSLAVALDNATHPCEDLIERDPNWKALREQAAKCLDVLDFDLGEWEKTEANVRAN